MHPDIPTYNPGASARPLSISPTDVSQFIRLDQCQRFLRLRLHARASSLDFMHDYDVAPQAIPPILSQSGATFEAAIERDVALRFPSHRFSEQERAAAGVTHDNAAVVSIIQALRPGGVQVLFQPRLEAHLGDWRLRGDVDLIRAERASSGTLHLLIADMKSSTAAKVEHRLQVAFYHEMLQRILHDAGIGQALTRLAILYRGPAIPPTTPAGIELHEQQRAEAASLLGAASGLLEYLQPQEAYIDSVHELVLGDASHARRIVTTPFADLPFHLTMKCDGCLFNEFCMKQADEADDLSLLPHITESDKSALRRHGVATTRHLAALKDIRRQGTVTIDGEEVDDTHLVPSPDHRALARQLATTWPVGPRLDELVHRARRYRHWKRDPVEYLPWIPGKGYSSLPWTSPDQNANLVMVYLDAQHDYLHDRLYLLGALVVGYEGGEPHPNRRRSVVCLADGPPDTHEIEESLLRDWVDAAIRAIVDVAAPDGNGELKAPIHLVFNDGFAQKALLDALARHTSQVLGTTALYDFVTQIAAFDSPLASFLDTQIREKKNYPMVCQSLQTVAAYLRFDWNAGTPYRDIFRARLFDFWSKRFEAEGQDPGQGVWYTGRARFNSQVPLEYAYNAWGELPAAEPGTADEFAGFRAVDPGLLVGFQARRLEAMEHIARDFQGNRQTTLTPFSLPDLAGYVNVAPSMAHALAEFVTIERHVRLAAWKNARHAAPEARVLAGNTLIVRYVEDDQLPGVAEQNQENERRRLLGEQERAAWKAAHPDAKQVRLPKDVREACSWDHKGLVFRLRIEPAGSGCELNEALALSTIKEGARLVIFPRHTVDTRLPPHERKPFTPTPKQLLWGLRADLQRIDTVRRDGRVVEAWAEVTLSAGFGGGNGPQGYAFPTLGDHNRPLVPGDVYTLDEDPNDWTGLWAANLASGLIGGGQNAMYALLARQPRPEPAWPSAFAQAQRRFLAGLDALHAAGALHPFEESKREFIGEHANAGLLMVQGPPGTGKSYSTAFALLARLQGAMACNRDMRILLSCKTHSATDVLIDNLAAAQDKLARLAASHPDIVDRYIDRRLLEVPLFRFRPRADLHHRIVRVPKDDEREDPHMPAAWARFSGRSWCVIAATPGGIHSLVKARNSKAMFDQHLVQCLVLDEASQMSLPEAIMAALPLTPGGNVIVVGDHRQMPPIVANDWASERRRTFAEFRTYESLFLTLLELQPPVIRFAESFRLHADVAEFLRREIYHLDGIDYHSNQTAVIPYRDIGDSFVTAVLNPRYPLTVVVHDEAASQVRNPFEQLLLTPLLAMLADPAGYNLKPDEGFGVVVPHRAQRAALQDSMADLKLYDQYTGELLLSGVDTVERYQGDERTIIIFGATESDRDYLLSNSKFLLEPRRLTVALSRAKQKLVVVAARSVFELFSADEEAFTNARLWKNLLRDTCTVPLWGGERDGYGVEVWGNRAISTEERL